MSKKKYPFPKKTGTLQKHNFKNKLDIFLTLVLAEKGMYKYNDKELSEMTEKRFTLRTNTVSTNYPSGRIFDNKKQHSLYLDEIVDVLNRQDYAIEVKQKYIEKLEKQLEQIPKSIREVWLE